MRVLILVPLTVPVALAACDAVDRCLDRGGRWNSERQACELAPAQGPALTTGIYGDWHVVSFEQPGISALSPDEARAWLGRPAHFSDSLVMFGNDRCERPTYVLDTLSAGEFLEGLRVSPAALKLGDTVRVTHVRCDGKVWPASEIYQRGAELLALSDGTFFVLRRR